jgi:tRNA pseudouridine55 synthase
VTLRSLVRTAPWRWPDLEFEVCASKGTYVRTLAEQIAGALGTVAHLVALRRLATGGFRIEDAHTIEALEAAAERTRADWLLPADRLVADLPAVELDEPTALRLVHGQEVAAPSAGMPPEPGARLRAYRARRAAGLARSPGDFLGVVVMTSPGRLRPQRLLATSSSGFDAESA